jgi:hypothetical protein
MTELAVAPVILEDDDEGDDLVHAYCCDENISICGLDITDHAEIDWWGEERDCIVCLELEKLPCERCGAQL